MDIRLIGPQLCVYRGIGKHEDCIEYTEENSSILRRMVQSRLIPDLKMTLGRTRSIKTREILLHTSSGLTGFSESLSVELHSSAMVDFTLENIFRAACSIA